MGLDQSNVMNPPKRDNSLTTCQLFFLVHAHQGQNGSVHLFDSMPGQHIAKLEKKTELQLQLMSCQSLAVGKN